MAQKKPTSPKTTAAKPVPKSTSPRAKATAATKSKSEPKAAAKAAVIAAKAPVAKAAPVKRDAHAAVPKAGADAKTIKKPSPAGKPVSKPVSASAKSPAAQAPAKLVSKVPVAKSAVAKKIDLVTKPTAAKAAAPVASHGKSAPAKSIPTGVHSATAKALLEQRAATHKPVAAITAPATPKDLAQKVAQAQQSAAAAAAKKPVNARHGFKTNEWIVYPAHGVGRIVAIEEQEIANMSLELFVITFEKDKMTLRVPTGKAQTVGMRKLADEGIVKRAMETLKGKARIKRTMWSRRAQEFEAKINSGDLVSIAEVVRDLFRAENQPEQSYSERQLYEAALDRMAREIAAVDRLDERGAVQRITEVLVKSAKGRRAIAEEAPPSDAAIEAA